MKAVRKSYLYPSPMEVSSERQLTVVVPFTEPTEQMRSWIPQAIKLGIDVVLVHDQLRNKGNFSENQIQDSQIQLFVKSGARLFTGEFGNPGAARNFGKAEASTKWLTFWDSDDLPKLHSVASAIYKYGDSDFDYLIGDYTINNQSSSVTQFKSMNDRTLHAVAMRPGIWRFIFNRKSLSETSFPELSMGEDQIFLAEYGLSKHKGKFLEVVTYEYFTANPNSLTNDRQQQSQTFLCLYKAWEIFKRVESNDRDIVAILITKLTFSSWRYGNNLVRQRILKRIWIFLSLGSIKDKVSMARALMRVLRYRVSNG